MKKTVQIETVQLAKDGYNLNDLCKCVKEFGLMLTKRQKVNTVLR